MGLGSLWGEMQLTGLALKIATSSTVIGSGVSMEKGLLG